MEEKKAKERLFDRIPAEEKKPKARLLDRISAEEAEAEKRKLQQKLQAWAVEQEKNPLMEESISQIYKEGLYLKCTEEPVHKQEGDPFEAFVGTGVSVPEQIQEGGLSFPLISKQMPVTEVQAIKVSKKFDFHSAEFIYQNGKLWALDAQNQSKLIGNFSLFILGKIIEIEEIINEANEVITENRTVMWDVEITTMQGQSRGTVKGDIYNLDWIRRISEEIALFENTTENRRLLSLYLQKQIQAGGYSEIQQYLSAGWKTLQTKERVYVTAEGAIGFPDMSVKAVDKFRLSCSAEKNLQSIFREYIGMRTVISGKVENAVFLQYYLMTALMTAIFKQEGHQIEFCVATIGKTNTKKTSCAEVFTRVFNRTPAAVPDINFSATEAAIYEIMDRYADQIVLIDDLTPSENDMDSREKQKKLELILRSYGDRVPRKRSVSYAQNSTAKEFTPITGCALLTGETFSAGKSSRSRVVILRFEEEDVDIKRLSYYQENLQILPNFVSAFLEYVTFNLDRVKESIRLMCDEMRRSNPYGLKMPRFLDALGTLYATSAVFYGFVVENRLLSVEQAKELIDRDKELLAKVLLQNDAELSVISPGVTIMEALQHSIQNGRIKMKRKEEVQLEEAEKSLLYDENYYYITAERLWECAKQFTDYRRIHFPYQESRKIIEPLKNEDLIYRKYEGKSLRSSHKIYVHGELVNTRFLWLEKDRVHKIWADLEEVEV